MTPDAVTAPSRQHCFKVTEENFLILPRSGVLANERKAAIVRPTTAQSEHFSEVRRMTAIRAVLIATIILGLAATPLVAQVFGGSSVDEAYAAFAGSGRQDGDSMAVAQRNNNRNDNNNNNS